MSSKPPNFRQVLSKWFSRVFTPEKIAKEEQIEALVRRFDPREREAVAYLRWLKTEALTNYNERVRSEKRTAHPLVSGLDTTIESFIQFLDGYRQLKQYLRGVNREQILKAIEKEEAARTEDPEHDLSHLDSLQKRLRATEEVQRKLSVIEGQLRMIESFFGLVHAQGAVIRSGGSLKSFEDLLENDLQGVLKQISVTKERLHAENTPANYATLTRNDQTPKQNQSETTSSTPKVPAESQPKQQTEQYDLFLSHAFEDKDTIARPLYRALVANGVTVWFDEAELLLGDSLRRRIDAGLAKCRFGIVILSPKFLNKHWPQRELDALVARETATGEKAILPIWHELDRDTLMQYSPALSDRLAGRSEDGIDVLVSEILRVLSR